jgi:D-sedoheptulose 7-phosphate isomerase
LPGAGGESRASIDQRSGYEAKPVAAEYLRAFTELLERVDLDAVERVVEHLRRTRDSDGTVYIAGNGGSAATASHWANDLGKTIKVSSQAFMRVLCLSDNVPWLTALANDEGYERVFSGQLENFAAPGDLFFAISASGSSRNLIEAVELARDRDVVTVALLGFDGGALKALVDEFLWLPTAQGEYGLVESGHSVLCDILTTCLLRDTA